MHSPFDKFRYIYPPRPETKAPPSGLKTYEQMGFIGQPKLNGSYGETYTDGSSLRFMGRHDNTFSSQLIKSEHLKSLHRGRGWTVLCGEYMNKSKKDGKGRTFNAVYVIFDIIVYNGQHLVGTTFLERQELLEELYPYKEPFDEFISLVSPSVYRVHNFESEFDNLYKKMIKVDMYEGFVLKRPTGILENGVRMGNNQGWQLKIRKATANYSY
jgi:hypothetical protein